MRFIGNKENLVKSINKFLISNKVIGDSFFDLFAGTTNVGKFFKQLNYQTFSSDLLYFSFVLQKAYIAINVKPRFTKLNNYLNLTKGNFRNLDNIAKTILFLNEIKPVKGFIYRNYTPTGTKNLEYPRKYFTDLNGGKIDAIRQAIEDWYLQKFINENEYFYLLACLIEAVPYYSNILGVYAAFHKKWDPRALKILRLKPIQTINNNKQNYAFNVDSVQLIKKIKADIYYLDPPYNHRQYAPNYHILETIAKYDNPLIKGITGLRDYQKQKSKFCNKSDAITELSFILENGLYNYLVLSYNSEGLIEHSTLKNLLENYGKLNFIEFDYMRFKSNNNGSNSSKKFIKEYLYILQK